MSTIAGGVARQGETCGAIIGAIAAINLIVGRETIQDVKAYQAAMPASIAAFDKFRAELKKEFSFTDELPNCLCREIQKRIYGRGFIMTDPKDLAAFVVAGGHTAKGCPLVCAVAAEIAAEKLSELLK